MSEHSAAHEEPADPAAEEPERPRLLIQSVCECQASLQAELGDDHLVLRGWASRRGLTESAPANTIGKPGERFDVAWHCPMCGRNTLRTFHEGAIQKAG